MSLLLAALLALSAPAAAAPRPIVIAHRGASGSRPEHTIEAYRLAIEQGADFIEPDLVMTRDRVLVARHENEISETTDVGQRPEFAARRTTRRIDGRNVTGWFTEDFTLAELRTLRARERLPQLRPANARFGGRFPVPTFDEVIALAKAEGRKRGCVVGLYPELKHPAHFRSIGLPMEGALVEALTRHGYRRQSDPVFIQSFEIGPLERLNALTKLRLVQLIAEEGAPADRRAVSYASMVTAEGLARIARYADGIGPAKALILPRGADGRTGAPTGLVAAAHRAGLVVHPWTFRSENHFLPAEHRRGADPRSHGDHAAEYRRFIALGVDGLFSDFPAHARAAVDRAGANRTELNHTPLALSLSKGCPSSLRWKKDRASTGLAPSGGGVTRNMVPERSAQASAVLLSRSAKLLRSLRSLGGITARQ